MQSTVLPITWSHVFPLLCPVLPALWSYAMYRATYAMNLCHVQYCLSYGPMSCLRHLQYRHGRRCYALRDIRHRQRLACYIIRYAVSGTAAGAMVLRGPYAVAGTDEGYAATRRSAYAIQ
eukprot:3136139-Rhodomonas_salina.1